jgi:hypothetical protein
MSWKPTTEKPQESDLDIYGQVFALIGNTVARLRPCDFDKTVTHWMPTGIQELPNTDAKEAFQEYWARTHDGYLRTHRRESQEAFIEGWNMAVEACARQVSLPNGKPEKEEHPSFCMEGYLGVEACVAELKGGN